MSSTKIKGTPIINYAAGAVFLLLGVVFLYYSLKQFLILPEGFILGTAFWWFPSIRKYLVLISILCLIVAIGAFLVSAGFFLSNLVLPIIGLLFTGFAFLINLILSLPDAFGFHVFMHSFCNLFYLIPCIMLAVSFLSEKKKPRPLALISAGIWFIGIVFNYFVFDGGRRPTRSTLGGLLAFSLFSLGAILFAFTEAPKRNVKKAQSTTSATSTKIESLSKLSDLLDKGIISQEEFEAKKQNILNS